MHNALDAARLAAEPGVLRREVVQVQSQAADRQTYLMRPDLGRALSLDAAAALHKHEQGYDVTLVVADGLSARAVQQHAAAVLQHVTTARPQLHFEHPPGRHRLC